MSSLKPGRFQIYGDGMQTRSFQYVSDLVDGLILLMNSNYTMPVNLGNDEEYTIEQFAHFIRDLVGSKSHIVKMDAVVDDPQKRRPGTLEPLNQPRLAEVLSRLCSFSDITVAKTMLGWKPRVRPTWLNNYGLTSRAT